jgi:hypothetical protein
MEWNYDTKQLETTKNYKICAAWSAKHSLSFMDRLRLGYMLLKGELIGGIIKVKR